LWGRAESVRSVFRGGLEAAAPVTFGLVADRLFGGRSDGGLRDTFLLMLVPLLISGLILLLATRTYPRDVATADATEQALRSHRSRRRRWCGGPNWKGSFLSRGRSGRC
jgi:hypothetical protein